METVLLRTLYVLFLIEVGTRWIRIVGVTPNPDGRWVAQQARNLALEGRLDNVGFLIRDRDAKFSSAFDEVVRTEDARVILTPIRAPRAKSLASHCTSVCRFDQLSVREGPTHPLDEPRVSRRGRLVELLVLVVGLVADEQTGPVPVLDRARVHPEPVSRLGKREQPFGAQPVGVAGKGVSAA